MTTTMRRLLVETTDDIRTVTGDCCSSTVRDATPNEIRDFRSYPCDHTAKALLVYDLMCGSYDLRCCAVCDAALGLL